MLLISRSAEVLANHNAGTIRCRKFGQYPFRLMRKFLSDPLAYVGVTLTISMLVWYFAGRHAHKSVSWSCCGSQVCAAQHHHER